MEKKEVLEWICQEETAYEKVARELLESFRENKKIAIQGSMGAGKTTLIKFLCRHLGVLDEVTSPTFALINEYQYDLGKVYHMDLYRLKTLEEALDIGIEDYLYDPHYCFIEWPQVIEPILPEHIIRIQIKILKNSTRKILFL